MRCLAVCQDELVIRMLDEILLPGFEIEFVVDNRLLARRLHDLGVDVPVERFVAKVREGYSSPSSLIR